ncbi:MAG: molybdenum cofactor biosynthesis protein B [Polyangiales bacterium]|jgi:molybdenum cofactor biosynthesis protein B
MGGPRFDESIPFKGLRIAIMTVSDTRTEETDKSGALLVELAQKAGHHVMDKVIVPDDRKRIGVQLRRWINEPNVEVILATGGTGVTARDVTPEAFEEVWEKPIPGFGELFRMLSYEQIGTSTIQSRACAGVARGTYLFALPGSTGACRDAWDGILRYQLDIRYRPCNFAELIPRLTEVGSAG